MEYLVVRRFRGVCLGGRVNLPAGTACICREGVICWGEKPVCLVASDVAHRFLPPTLTARAGGAGGSSAKFSAWCGGTSAALCGCSSTPWPAATEGRSTGIPFCGATGFTWRRWRS